MEFYYGISDGEGHAAGDILVEIRSPEKAGEMAFKVFCRAPARKPRGEKEIMVLRRAEKRMAEAESVRMLIPGAQVVAHAFEPDSGKAKGANVLLVHGYRSRSEHMLRLVDGLTAQGNRVVCLDLPGHGASTGRVLHLGNAVAAIDATWRQFGPFDAMVGHSFGGPSVLAAAAGAILSVPARVPERLVTIASPAAMPEIFHRFSARMDLSPRVQAVFEKQVIRVSGRPLSFFVADELIAAIQSKVLAIHCSDDREVPFAHAEAMAASGGHVTLKRVDGLGHRRILAAQPVVEAVADFLRPERMVTSVAGKREVFHGGEPEPRRASG